MAECNVATPVAHLSACSVCVVGFVGDVRDRPVSRLLAADGAADIQSGFAHVYPKCYTVHGISPLWGLVGNVPPYVNALAALSVFAVTLPASVCLAHYTACARGAV